MLEDRPSALVDGPSALVDGPLAPEDGPLALEDERYAPKDGPHALEKEPKLPGNDLEVFANELPPWPPSSHVRSVMRSSILRRSERG